MLYSLVELSGYTVYGKTFEGETFVVKMNAHGKTFMIAAPFDNECLLLVLCYVLLCLKSFGR